MELKGMVYLVQRDYLLYFDADILERLKKICVDEKLDFDPYFQKIFMLAQEDLADIIPRLVDGCDKVMYQSIWLWKQRHGFFRDNVPAVNYEEWFDSVDIHRTMNRVGYLNVDKTEWEVEIDEVTNYELFFSRYMARYPVTTVYEDGSSFFNTLATIANILAVGDPAYFERSKAFFSYLLDHPDSEF